MMVDAHTHNLLATDAVISVEPAAFDPLQGRLYSVGLHPWNTEHFTDEQLAALAQVASHPQVVAIGETGMDALRGATVERQRSIFADVVRQAQALGKPLIVHCVRRSQDIIRVLRDQGVTVPCVIHGMRANPRVAQQLLGAGCYLSFGVRFNPDTVRATPTHRLLIETDDSGAFIHQVAEAIAPLLHLDAPALFALASRNLQAVLSLKQ